MNKPQQPFTAADSDYVISEEDQRADPALLVNPQASFIALLDAAHVRVMRVGDVLRTMGTNDKDIHHSNALTGLAAILDEATQLIRALSAKDTQSSTERPKKEQP